MPDVPLTAGPLSAAGPFPLLCSGLSLLPEPVLAAASVPPVLPLRVARSIRPAPAIRRSWTNLRPCGETLPPPGWRKKAADRWFGAGLKWCNDLINQVVTFLYRIIGNEKATVYFQLLALKYCISNNLSQNTKNFGDRQIRQRIEKSMFFIRHLL